MKKNFDYHSLLGEGNPLLRYPLLLEAAIDEFSQKKFEDASLNDILKNSNMSKGSLYHHFGDKFGLYLSVLDIIIKKKVSFFVPLLQKNEDSGDFFNTVKAIVRGTMEFMYDDERLYHLSNRNLESSDELKNQIFVFFPYDYSQMFGGLIQSAIQSGQIENRFSPQFIAKVLEILFFNVHKLLSPGKSPEEIIDVLEQLVELMQYGISAKKEE